MTETNFGFEDFSRQPTIDITPPPSKCDGCAIQCESVAELVGLILEKRKATDFGGALMGEAGEQLDEIIEAHLPADEAEEIKQQTREAVSRGIDDIDKEIDAVQQEINANALSCAGVLKMRAAKDDVSYTVNVCTSARVHVRDGDPQHLPAHIQAKSVNKPA